MILHDLNSFKTTIHTLGNYDYNKPISHMLSVIGVIDLPLINIIGSLSLSH